MYRLGQGISWFGVDPTSTNGQGHNSTLSSEIQAAILAALEDAPEPNRKLMKMIESPQLQEKLLLMT